MVLTFFSLGSVHAPTSEVGYLTAGVVVVVALPWLAIASQGRATTTTTPAVR